MNRSEFQAFSPVHIATLVACILLPASIAIAARFICANPRVESKLRLALGMGNLVVWVLSIGFLMQPGYFQAETSLPLHFCNLANLVGAAALLWRSRLAQSLLYFWTFALCIWAFLTPSLTVGPSHPWFWLFWLYHLFIPLSTVWVFAIDRFRPSLRDFFRSYAVTVGYAVVLMIINRITGWNYGFVGPGKPGQATVIDLIGPYPLRLIWMILITAVLFLILLLPWIRKNQRPPSRINTS